MSLTSNLYRIARISAWARAASKLAQGNPTPLIKRVRNKAYFRMFGRFLK